MRQLTCLNLRCGVSSGMDSAFSFIYKYRKKYYHCNQEAGILTCNYADTGTGKKKKDMIGLRLGNPNNTHTGTEYASFQTHQPNFCLCPSALILNMHPLLPDSYTWHLNQPICALCHVIPQRKTYPFHTQLLLLTYFFSLEFPKQQSERVK